MTEIMNTIITGDCLVESDRIPSGSVDLILTDLPYGNMNTDGGRKLGINGWDLAIDPKKVFEIANRILRKNGKMVLFSQEPYTTRLINEAIPSMPFSYRAVWEKDGFANALGVNKNMVSFYEDILVFCKPNPKHDLSGVHPLKERVRELQEKHNVFWNGDIAKYYYESGYSKSFNNAKAVLKHFLNWDYVQFGLCTEQHYERLEYFWDWGDSYEELKKLDVSFKEQLNRKMNEENPNTFNLWEGKKYKSNILKYKKDYNGYHPTQKPLLLLEDLIRTFSNENDTVVDLTAGSCSTAVAAVITKRNFIVIEQDVKYTDIGRQRVSDAFKTEVDG